ncbi:MULTISPECIES: DUF4194 domain-containing protein [unclassified Cryobacterium]|uniref:DUF4194 domain-containing protein n=1 Tax=unclassified Cryobacterium TaxID=2649013 RepID=UPI0010691AB1|nr:MULTISPECIES: DUF4194 domain-containing protein [unclassified Cryobacterium]TFC50338.1 DUF4194 domain-containing protein [Cryobacterium sp. TMB3-1-2]TFC71927.1 DUF4194 domain-containing protein [Cryobacterium sp. TMB3-15]TFC78520.1 DUF4194 domain-containing protein [Cryobacterium sp. TMB3-10]TFD44577.1 DUF4194 domain-containing protein [Cryobacterium sp. TMB3-12]
MTDFGTETGTNTETDAASATALWAGDTGVIGEQSRRALLELIKGPYLSGVKAPALWSALLADEVGIRSRLHELFLELVIDRVGEFAFVRNVSTTELKVPSTVRTAALTFLDTAMLLVLRQMLLAGEGGGRVIVGQEDVFEQLRVYRTVDRDESDFNKRLNSTWLKMKNTLRVIHQAGAEDRAEISPVLRLIVDAEQIAAISGEYKRIAASGGAGSHTNVGGVDDADGDVTDDLVDDQSEGITS